jgi:hypothetical protein
MQQYATLSTIAAVYATIASNYSQYATIVSMQQLQQCMLHATIKKLHATTEKLQSEVEMERLLGRGGIHECVEICSHSTVHGVQW